MAKKKSSKAVANIKENRLYITLVGTVPKKEAETLYTDIRFCVSDLQPGFSVITDLTNCRIGHLSAVSTSKKIMSFLIENQVGQVVRIVGDSRLVYLQIARISDKLSGYKPIYVKTLEEAKETLDTQEATESVAQYKI